ncbi:DUF1491 family protein [Algihabitans albus]|uniref:DUF1491 family protein n=1 Tax=Algihabitans albus TaxID=2164067 RepID=UPI000E5D5A1A|nr:DUF1491 family protein [Algihabitans albus]
MQQEDDTRIPTHLWVMAQVRRCNDGGQPAYVLRKGERMSGLVLVKLALLDGTAKVLVQQRDLDGRLGWMLAKGDGPIAEPEADAYIARTIDRDPDLWVVEVEARDGLNPFEGTAI